MGHYDEYYAADLPSYAAYFAHKGLADGPILITTPSRLGEELPLHSSLIDIYDPRTWEDRISTDTMIALVDEIKALKQRVHDLENEELSIAPDAGDDF